MNSLQEGRPNALQAEVPCIGIHQDRKAHDCPGTVGSGHTHSCLGDRCCQCWLCWLPCAQEFEQLAAEDQKGEGTVVQARLENIRLSTSIAKKEALIRKKVKECMFRMFGTIRGG